MMIVSGAFAWYCTVRNPPRGVALPSSTLCRTGLPESEVAATKNRDPTLGTCGSQAVFVAGSHTNFSVIV
jgi:hypothetical protein